MRLDRRVSLPWLAFGALMVCAWCSALSGVGGWITGRDLARREAQVQLTAVVAEAIDLPELGVLVTRLDLRGPAALGGLERGDLIVALNGVHVQDARDLRDQLSGYLPNDVVRLAVLRGKAEQDLMVRLGAFPGDEGRPYLGIYYTARAEEPGDV